MGHHGANLPLLIFPRVLPVGIVTVQLVEDYRRTSHVRGLYQNMCHIISPPKQGYHQNTRLVGAGRAELAQTNSGPASLKHPRDMITLVDTSDVPQRSLVPFFSNCAALCIPTVCTTFE